LEKNKKKSWKKIKRKVGNYKKEKLEKIKKKSWKL
jgi:hypothetical protein